MVRKDARPLSAAWPIAVLALWLGNTTTAHAQFLQAQPELIGMVAQADVLGGFSSQYIIVRAKPGVQPSQQNDGHWTFTHNADAVRAEDGNPRALNQREALQIEALAQAETISAAAQRWKVISIEPLLSKPPANAALAETLGLDRYYRVRVPTGTNAAAMAAEFAAFDHSLEVSIVDVIGGIASVPDDASFSMQWGMNNTGQSGGTVDADIDAPECWELHQGSADIIVAVLDTGVQQSWTITPPNPDITTIEHPDLAGRVIAGWDFHDDNPNSSDYNGHGTHCAGTIAALPNNLIGVAGLNWNAKILAVKVLGDLGSGLAATVADGIIFATDNNADIISMSLQYYNLPANHPLEAAVAYAYDSGVLPIAATGNNNQGGLDVVAYPAKYPKCMAIGATDRNDLRWANVSGVGSNTGPEIDIVAPGKSIFSTWDESTYFSNTGTSMAVPHVSGLASLMRSYNPSLTIAQIESILKTTSEDKGAVGFDTQYGWGRINAFDALRVALPGCAGDVTQNDSVDVDDLLAVINNWGPCDACLSDIAPTVAGNGEVDVDDLLAVINGWGACGP